MANQFSTTIVLKVSGKEVENSFNGLRSTVSKFERELRKLTPGTKKFIQKSKELKEARREFERVRNEIDLVNGKLNQSGNVFKNILGTLSSFGFGLGQIFTVFSVSKVAQISTELLKVADAMTDVQKTTGMALEEVKQLWDAFDEMDTRTSKLDRLKIAEVGGRLGVPKEQMASFVQEVDKAYVALGDSFDGGLESVVDSLGKIKGLFEETQPQTYAEAINSIGSALNELAANGTASEGNIANFALRVGALPDALKPGVDKVLGLGAAFEESGVDAQIAASGFSNFMKVAGENLEKFAYSMNMSIEEARALFNEHPEEFFLRFSEGMKSLPADETAKVFDSLKINSLEVQKAVGAAANRTEAFREALQRAGVTMAEASSLTEEFNKKNNNAPAIIEKLKNAFSDMFTKTNILNEFEGLIRAVGWLTGITKEAGDGVIAFKERVVYLFNIIKVATVAMLSYKFAVELATLSTKKGTLQTTLYTLAEKASTLAKTVGRGATLLYAGAKALLTGNITRATAAMRLFNTVTKVNPLGLLITVVTTAYTAYKVFSTEVDEATRKQKLFNQVNRETNTELTSQKNELSSLLKVAQNENAAKAARIEALKKLNELSPEYLGNLSLENINTQEATNAIKRYTDALYKNARMKVLNKKMDEKMEEIENLKNTPVAEVAGKDWLWKITGGVLKLTPTEAQNLDRNMFKQMEKWKQRMGGGEVGEKYAEEMMKIYGSYYDKAHKKVQVLQNEFSALSNEYITLMEKDLGSGGFSGGENRIVPETPNKPKANRSAKVSSKDERQAAQSEYQKALELNDKNNKELLELQQRFQDEYFKTVQDGKQKEWDLEFEDFKRKKEAIEQENQERLTANKKLQNEIDGLSVKKNNAKNPAAKAILNATISEKQKQQTHNLKMIEENEKLEAQMLQTHGYNLIKIEEKWAIKSYQKEVELLQKKAEAARKSSEDMINNITTLEEARMALSQMTYLKLTDQELRGIKTLEDAKKALREDADRVYLSAQLESMNKQKENLQSLLQDPSLQGEAMAKLKEDLFQLEIQITKVKSAIQGNKEEDEAKAQQERKQQLSKIDLLGFSADQWSEMFDNLDTTEGKIRAVHMATQALGNAFSRFSQLQQRLNDRDFQKFSKNQEKKKKALLLQLNQGLISQEEYHKGVQQLDEETSNKKAELSLKMAKFQKAVDIMGAISGTAVAVVNALGAKPFTPANLALAGIVGALGAVQIATIASTPLPEKESFAKGGYTGVGYGSPDKTGKRPAGIVHGNEYVTPEWMLENPIIADTVEWMESIRTGRARLPQGYAEGGYVEDRSRLGVISVKNSEEQRATSDPQLLAVQLQLKELLEELRDHGVDAYIVENAENGRKLKKMIRQFEKIENKNARKTRF